jgi:hypothetical protein
MRGFIADKLLMLSSAFHWASVKTKDGALYVLTFGRRSRRGR